MTVAPWRAQVSRFRSSPEIAGHSERTSESKDTSKSMILVPLLNPKFANARAASLCELRVRGTRLNHGIAARGKPWCGARGPAAMTALDVLRSARAVLAGARTGPTLFEVCDPLLRGAGGGDQHLRRFYKTAVANPVLRLLLGRAGLPQLREEARLRAVQEAIRTARDAAGPDWGAVAMPVAELIDEFPQQHPKRTPDARVVAATARTPIDELI